MNNICKCGHSKWDHAIGLDGSIGQCFKEIVKGWKYCDCEKFEPKDDKVEIEKETKENNT